MSPLQWLKILQLSDSFFPLGAFSYSDGLETAVLQQHVSDGESLAQWSTNWLRQIFLPCEGVALVQIMRAWPGQDWSALQRIDTELTALKPSSTTRAASMTLGRRLLKTCLPLYPKQGLEELEQRLLKGSLSGNVVTIYAVLYALLQIAEEEALLSYAYTRLAGMISAALRLMSIGQQAGQLILSRQLETLPEIVQTVMQRAEAPLSSFAPLTDIAQMNHRYLYTRLFRS